jgi:MFS superfamily sulfate permease-like transporter
MIYSVYNAAVGIIESIMTVQAMGEMLGTKYVIHRSRTDITYYAHLSFS